MFTRCPGCKTVHPLNAALLAQGNGLYRCGECNKVSNALQNLFDFRPEADDKPSSAESASRQPPVLSAGSEPEPDSETTEAPHPEVAEVESRPPDMTRNETWVPGAAGFKELQETAPSRGKFWMMAAIVLGFVTLANLFFVSGDELLAQPSIRATLAGMGLVEALPENKYRNLDLLHLASSEMRSHPTLDENLILNATIVNRADRTQAFPALQITLFDAQNQPLALRVFSPDEYLPSDHGQGDGIAPGAYLPVIMELLDPGQHAVGFEMKFL